MRQPHPAPPHSAPPLLHSAFETLQDAFAALEVSRREMEHRTAQLSALFHTISDAVLVQPLADRGLHSPFIQANRAARVLFGTSHEALLRRSLADLCPAEVLGEVSHLLDAPGHGLIDFQLVVGDAPAVPAVLSVQHFTVSGDPFAIYVIKTLRPPAPPLPDPPAVPAEALGVEHLVHLTIDHLQRRFPACRVGVARLEGGDRLHVLYSNEPDALPSLTGRTWALDVAPDLTRALQSGVPIRVPNVPEELQLEALHDVFAQAGAAALLALPFRYGSDATGVLFAHAVQPTTWSTDDFDAFERTARFLSDAVRATQPALRR